MEPNSIVLGFVGIATAFTSIAAFLSCDLTIMWSLVGFFMGIFELILAVFLFWLDVKILE